MIKDKTEIYYLGNNNSIRHIFFKKVNKEDAYERSQQKFRGLTISVASPRNFINGVSANFFLFYYCILITFSINCARLSIFGDNKQIHCS